MKVGTKVVVTTDKDKRGIFYGVLESHDLQAETAKLTDARMCIYFCKSTRGVLGLAGIGPQPGSRVTPAIPSIELTGVTSVMECSDEACAKWEEGPWS